MFKKLFILILLSLSCVQSPVQGLDREEQDFGLQEVPVSNELRSHVAKILSIPMGRELVASIQREGEISVAVVNDQLSRQFGAYWDEATRTIFINPSAHHSKDEITGSIIFELYNAAANSEFKHWDTLALARKIKKDDYVEAVEYVEYKNSLKAAELAQEGIKRNLWSFGARLGTYRNFEEHYHFQKMGGHSAWIAQNYDEMAGARGTFNRS